jgi:glycosyltransferase involved in cell wall biosynthesis
VIVVNDGSGDATPAIIDELARTYPRVRIVHHPTNRGYGGALQTGFRTATKELIFYTDGDAQYDPAELAALWAKMAPGVDLVNGYKISRSDRCTASSSAASTITSSACCSASASATSTATSA